MKLAMRYLAGLAVVVVAACSNDAPSTAPAAADRAAMPERGGAGGVTVMTQNLYVGADVDAVIGALATPDPNDDVPALLAAVATIDRTDFPARARAIAKEIRRTRPEVVGLQEVSTLDVELPPLGVSVHLDFLQILLDALQAEGLNYTVAATGENLDAEPAPGISLVDREVMLVRADRVQVLSSAYHRFTYNLGVVAPGVDLERGWVEMTAVIGGRTYAVASMHTEGSGPEDLLLDLHAAQVADVVTSLGEASPAIVIGDFNSQPASPAYQVMEGTGFTDVWAALRPGAPGLTCCELPDLSNPRAVFTERIDYVWTRGMGAATGPGSLRGAIDQFGAVPSDRLRNSAHQWIWPSDHAGLVATIMDPPARDR